MNVKRMLKPNGLFISFNGFRNTKNKVLTTNEMRALSVVEKAMAANLFYDYQEWLSIAKDAGFEVEVSEDLSFCILPNVRRFRRMSSLYFASISVSRIFSKLVPKILVQNAIAGYLMYSTLQSKMHNYNYTVLRRLG